MATVTPYTSNLEQLRDELRRLDLILESAIAEFRARRAKSNSSEYRGLYISDQEIDDLVAPGTQPCADDAAELGDKVARLRREIDQRIAASHRAKGSLRLPHLCSVFGLGRFEADVLLLALAPELDLRYQKIYAYLQDDVSRKHPSVDLALKLFCGTSDERIKGRDVFAESSPLIASYLLLTYEDPAERSTPLLARFLKMDDRVVEFLLGSDRLDRRLFANLRVATCAVPQIDLQSLVIPEALRTRLEKVVSVVKAGSPVLCVLHGPAGVGKKSAAEAIGVATGRSLILVDLSVAFMSDVPFQILMRLTLREARLYGCLVYLDGWHELLKDELRNHRERYQLAAIRTVEQEMERFPGLILLGSCSPWHPVLAGPYQFIDLEFPMPDDPLRRNLWKHLGNGCGIGREIDAGYLAGAFRFTGGQIRRAIGHAERDARLQHGEDYELTLDDLVAGCRVESRQHLVAFSKKITPRRCWSDLVVPKDTLAQLRELCLQVRHQAEVYGNWGFGQRISLGKGLIALFTGPSGTGKTLSAEVLGNELGLDLYKIDLSSVVSKYVGETEKNLSRVFQDAQDSNAILFFDEADALFGKRTEVKDAHDRYANIETNYLLQQVEEYEGVVILATNMSKNIDSAFLRRMHFCIEFPFPDESQRAHIWRGIFPPRVLVGSDIDFDFLSRQFKIAGGNIKNVALAAAFRAAENGGVIRMEHLILALKREYQKLGKVCERAEFEGYYDLVR